MQRSLEDIESSKPEGSCGSFPTIEHTRHYDMVDVLLTDIIKIQGMSRTNTHLTN